MSFIFDKVHEAVHNIGNDIKGAFTSDEEKETHAHTSASGECSDGAHAQSLHRYQSFAPERAGNDVKWFVDACGYMWAVSMALERARESIWILDWWLSPELYLRRPPAKNEQYRVDRMLQAAAERGVKVNIIVYKEVTQALTLSSSHTKHELEDLHPNIAVFRHPDHLPDEQALASEFWSEVQEQGLTASTASKLPMDALKAIYGVNEETVLYWAHHEKLCLIDGEIAFMGGIDLCYGRWDTNQHSIADAHPSDLERIIFPGQDYNNARIMDFQDVAHWQNNKLDRTYNSRMGWSDLSISLRGPVVEDLKQHFAQRWNFLYKSKYSSRQDDRYSELYPPESRVGIIDHVYHAEPTAGEGPDPNLPRSETMRDRFMNRFEGAREQIGDEFGVSRGGREDQGDLGGIPCQIMRSCAKWSHGTPVEHSIANAYIETIRDSKHFIYIENQFFITATVDDQKPIKNKIGAAITERIIRAARNNERFMMFIVMPAIPAFAGDLRADDALSTRAIMEFQYNSINRGGYSIMETIAGEGIDPMQYIRFFNLRNYDRINSSSAMKRAEQDSGVSYDNARIGYDQRYGADAENDNEGADTNYDNSSGQYDRYQEATRGMSERQGLGSSGRWDSVAECYMLGGEDIRNVPWEDGTTDEIDAFVSEELYVHSKILIADDRIVLCGSANLNDRSQLGDHDSEILIRVEDPREIDSSMAGNPWRATQFAASLRRQLFRKHLGLLPPQDPTQPTQNFEPIGVPNEYDWNSREDEAVVDPLEDDFQSLWYGTARTNTESFEQVFHPVPTDKVRTWKQYDDYFERFFKQDKEEKEDDKKDDDDKGDGAEGKDPRKEKPSTWKWGHVVAEDFPGGVEEVKEVLSRIRGTLVEMPLLFLKDEDIAKEGLGLNAFTEEVYT
ncbi:hypothetical protein AAFC00_002814 [Neodothiora populina]